MPQKPVLFIPNGSRCGTCGRWVLALALLEEMPARGVERDVIPTPATHAIWTVLKAGETADLIYV